MRFGNSNFDFYSALNSLLILFETAYYEITFQTRPVIPQAECGMPCMDGGLSLSSVLCSNSSMINSFRILNGQSARAHSFPWMASIRAKSDHNAAKRLVHFCGGAIIYPQYVLTVAHCVYNESASDLSVAVGLHAVNNLGKSNLYDVERVFIHPFYVDQVAYNDIAILKLKEPIKFGPTVKPICLPDDRQDGDKVAGKNGLISGWGSVLGYANEEPTVLQQSLLTIMHDQKECDKEYRLFDSTHMFCAIDTFQQSGMSSACLGDSGSPLVLRAPSGRLVLYGLASFVMMSEDNKSIECDSTKPSYFVKVSAYLNWITRSIIHMEKKPGYKEDQF